MREQVCSSTYRIFVGNICPDWDPAGAPQISASKGVSGMGIDETVASLLQLTGVRRNKRMRLVFIKFSIFIVKDFMGHHVPFCLECRNERNFSRY
jgi:hypothetical protein